MKRLRSHVISRLRDYGIALGWQALMIGTAFIGYCVASALMNRMAQVGWFAGIYIVTGLLIQGVKEVALYRQAIMDQD